jgi:hypothetical protein
MKIFSLFLVSALILLLSSSPLTADIDLTSSFSLSIPRGDLHDYSYGATGKGVSIRAAKNVSRIVKFFVQGNCSDFGLDYGHIRKDNVYSDANLESHTDFYIVSLSPGISVGKNLGGVIPYFSLSGGILYFSSLSRIHSPDISDLTLQMTNSGTSWCAGAGLGVKTMMWEPEKKDNDRLLDAIFVDFRVDYYAGGNVEYLNGRKSYYRTGVLHYENVASKSEMFMINFGINLRF